MKILNVFFKKSVKKDMRLSQARVIGCGGIYVPEKEIMDSKEYKEMQEWAEKIITRGTNI